MSNWHLISESAVGFTFKGKRFDASVRIAVTPDEFSVDGSFDYGDEEENAAYLARFESGELVNLAVRVEAVWKGIVGTDYLGGCHVKAGDEDEVQTLVTAHAMVPTALEDLVRELTERVAALAELTDGGDK